MKWPWTPDPPTAEDRKVTVYVVPEPVLDYRYEDGKVTVHVEKLAWSWVAKQRRHISGPWPWQACDVAETKEQAIKDGVAFARKTWPDDT